MSDRQLHQRIDDLELAIQAQENLRSLLGDSVVETTLAVLSEQDAELDL